MTDKSPALATGTAPVAKSANGLHYARRGSTIDEHALTNDAINGYDEGRMQARTLLTAEEEKKLMRRVDWRLMVSTPAVSQ